GDDRAGALFLQADLGIPELEVFVEWTGEEEDGLACQCHGGLGTRSEGWEQREVYREMVGKTSEATDRNRWPPVEQSLMSGRLWENPHITRSRHDDPAGIPAGGDGHGVRGRCGPGRKDVDRRGREGEPLHRVAAVGGQRAGDADRA